VMELHPKAYIRKGARRDGAAEGDRPDGLRTARAAEGMAQVAVK
jgi:hypothetical protein